MPEWRERASQGEAAPGAQFLDALQILRVLWEAHRAGKVATLLHLHGVVKLPMDRIEEMLDAMGTAHWVGRTGNGWALIRDTAEISVADVYHQFVFRPSARLPARQSGQELDHLALELAVGIEGRLQLPLAELFRRAAEPESTAVPLRIQAV
jgi:membrane protein